MTIRLKRRVVAIALLAGAAVTLSAQRARLFDSGFPVEGNPAYDGRLTFSRLRYPGLGGLTPEGEATFTMREDVPVESLGQKAALDQAPSAVAGHFQVPKVL